MYAAVDLAKKRKKKTIYRIQCEAEVMQINAGQSEPVNGILAGLGLVTKKQANRSQQQQVGRGGEVGRLRFGGEGARRRPASQASCQRATAPVTRNPRPPPNRRRIPGGHRTRHNQRDEESRSGASGDVYERTNRTQIRVRRRNTTSERAEWHSGSSHKTTRRNKTHGQGEWNYRCRPPYRIVQICIYMHCALEHISPI